MAGRQGRSVPCRGGGAARALPTHPSPTHPSTLPTARTRFSCASLISSMKVPSSQMSPGSST